jgi:hypothetical protein
MAKRKRRSFWREMMPDRMALRILFANDPPKPSDLTKHKKVASIRRDPKTGETKAKGVRQGTDGRWTEPAKRKKPATAKTKRQRESAAEQRRVQRVTQRLDRRAQQAMQRADAQANRNLKREFQQGPGGRMTGSKQAKNGLPTPRQATGLTRLGCDWCRSSGVRPIFTGEGQIKTVIAVQNCNHRWSSKDGGPSQKPAGRRDKFLCTMCANSGEVTLTTIRHGDGARTISKKPCFTCLGWILHW